MENSSGFFKPVIEDDAGYLEVFRLWKVEKIWM